MQTQKRVLVAVLVAGMALAFLLACGSTANTPAAPTVSTQHYTDWLSQEASALTGAGVDVLEALYPQDQHNIVWIRTSGLSQQDAMSWCKTVASDYVKEFHDSVVVHFYGPAGLSDELANCTDQP